MLHTLPFMRGASYMTLGKSVRMWQDWDPAQVRRDFATMEKAGMNTAKLYLFWDFFFPVPEEGLNQTAVARLDEALAIADEHNIRVIIDIIVGHMSGENYIAAWTEGRDLMHDPAMLRLQASYIRQLTSRYKNDPRILMWDVCNEISLYRLGREGRHRDLPALFDASPLGVLGEPPSTDESYMWLKTLADAARAGDGTHPVYSGVGTARGFSLRDVAEVTDVNACYAYNWGASYNQSSYLCGFERALASAYDLPCLVEEFGITKCWNSERYEADYYAAILYTSLLNGCCGALGWQYCDFQQLSEKDPYMYHAWEIEFGMVRDDGSMRPCCNTMRDFGAFMDSEKLTGLSLPKADICILLPETYDVPHAFNSAGQQSERGVYIEIYRRLRDAGLRVNFLHEDSDYASAPCILTPANGREKYKSRTWTKLQAYVQQGGTLWSEMSGFIGAQNFNALYGVQIDYTRLCSGREVIFEKDLASLGTLSVEAKLPVCVLSAAEENILARDRDGQPVLILHRQGKGKTLLSVLPLLSLGGDARNEEDNDQYQPIVAALRDVLGLRAKVTFDRPGLEAGIFSSEDNCRHIALAVNHRPGVGFEAPLQVAFPLKSVTDLDSGLSVPFQNTENGALIPLQAVRGEVKKLELHA